MLLEIKIGETVVLTDKQGKQETYLCKENPNQCLNRIEEHTCSGCAFSTIDIGIEVVDPTKCNDLLCYAVNRTDYTDVVFIKVEEE